MTRLSLLDAGQIYARRQIYLDYLAGAQKLGTFYKYFPADKQALRARVEGLSDELKVGAGLGEALVEYNQQIGAGTKALENARLLGDGQALAVVTGQQAGFAGGPLYSVYKAISAIKLAEYLSGATGKAVVPVFWIASEDTNVEQINASTWMDRQGQLRHIRADLGEKQQICNLRVEEAAMEAFEQLAELMPQSEFRSQWQAVYEPRSSEPWGQWFGRIYAWLFAEQGLVLLEPYVVYSRAGQIFRRIIASLAQLQETFAKSTAKLSEQGYEPQIESQGRGMVYLVEKGRRQGIVAGEGKITVGTSESYTLKDLSDLGGEHPERFSCSVGLRPVVQDCLLGTVAYVAGPGEISYYAQLGGLYEQLGVSMPVIWPRASMTLIEPKIARLMAKSGLTEQALLAEGEASEDVSEPKAEAPGAEVLLELAQKAGRSLEQLARKIKEQDSSAQRFADKISKRVGRDIERLLRRGLEFVNLDRQISRRQYERIRMSLRPAGKPQERAFSLFGYLVYYGQGVLEEIIRGVDVFDFRHRVVYLDFNDK
ncbi:MAG: bacillithiol biosynthesis cysteine-adding enzyme BshC [Phycisphaerae bacterium]|nr:bacillithiol biosynthesis cysteine-adding enzyme BshC [Phycisphaerae bacterium]